ncbi:putative CXXCH cytochrome family protein [Geothermobacter ehrlichii]|uniref:Putative CXXCH cytochrome family protein n=1 Tax=Geothermobacter ehrlichii TaxID=213224 RepID=A0A5D3WGV1_9BACT|nr:cytochrome c3 family protein [Geothermobacter ehrlichii]TYO96306.1 putative CXXCH cytochrome family protein [Geothermobacter ehrlichii]
MKDSRMPLLLILLLLLLPLKAEALIAAHQNYNGCDTCHSLHGSASDTGLLDEFSTETTCLACHGPLGIATEAAAHNPDNRLPGEIGYITCLECHNPHDNRGNSAGGTNIRLIGIEYDYNDSPPTWYPDAGIREENKTLGVVRDVVFESDVDGSADFNRGDGLGVCEICHSPNHKRDRDCTSCHDHATGFLPP